MRTITTFTGTNLDEALEGYEVSHLQAQREIEKHHQSYLAFLISPYNNNIYYSEGQLNSRDILLWLGY